MTDFSSFYPMIIQFAVDLVRMIIAVAFGVIILPWVKNNAIPWLKDKQLYGTIKQFVRAAEKLGDTGTIDKDAKLDYVLALLGKKGITATTDVRAMIESAVGDLDDEFARNMQRLINTLNEAGDAANIIYDDGSSTVSSDENEEPGEVPDEPIKE